MEIVDSKFGRMCVDQKSRKNSFGALAKPMGKLLSTLAAAANLEQLRNTPGRLKQMTADRAGQFEMRLSANKRLILEPILTDRERREHHSEGLDWSRITRIRLVEIYDPHGK